jgi:hypothetical protein
LQTNCENRFEFTINVDAFATYKFVEIPLCARARPCRALEGDSASLVAAGEWFRLAVVAEDLWGNPTRIKRPLALAPSRPIENLPARVAPGSQDGPRVFGDLTVAEPGDVDCASATPRLAKNWPAPIHCVSRPAHRCGAIGATCMARAARRLVPTPLKATSATPVTRRSSTSSDIRATTSRSPMRSGGTSTA